MTTGKRYLADGLAPASAIDRDGPGQVPTTTQTGMDRKANHARLERIVLGRRKEDGSIAAANVEAMYRKLTALMDELVQTACAEVAAAEAELSALSEQSREAYRRYRDLDAQQTAKATEVRELRAQLRAEENGEQS